MDMGFPDDIGIIETFVGMPSRNRKEVYEFLAPHLKEESQDYKMPAQYMFKDVPADLDESIDPVALLIDQLDRNNIETALLGFNPDNPDCVRALTDHPSRIVACLEFDPNDTMTALRRVKDLHEQHGLRAVSTFPAGYKVPIDDKKMYPFYAMCVELDLPIFVCVGIPGPRIPFTPQHVELIDEVMYDFPDLTFVMRHGAQPWTELAMKLMLKWPNLYYSTSAFAPKHYDTTIIDYANSRGADKVMYAGYFPAGLSYDRIFSELPNVPLEDEVWPKFLRENARRVLKL
jgi:predicted TIM-barrel fold metal-dependent hydrolase